MSRTRRRFGYLVASILVLAAFGVGITVLFDYGRTDRTHFDPVMP